MLQLAPLAISQQLATGIGRQAVLRLFLGNMQLQQHINHATALGGLLVNLAEQLQRIDSLDHSHIRHNVLHLVGLQMTDEVPLDVLRQRLVLLAQLLLVALPEEALSLFVGGHDVFVRMVLADSYQSDAGRQVGKHLVKISLYVVHDFLV